MKFVDRAGKVEPEGVLTKITFMSETFSCCLAASGSFQGTNIHA